MANIFNSVGTNYNKAKDGKLEDIIEYFYNMKQAGKDSEISQAEKEELGLKLVEKAKVQEVWYLFKHAYVNIPLIIKDKAFLYTDLEKALKAADQLRGKGVAVEVAVHKLFDEPIWEMLLRHGVVEVAFNKGIKGASVAMSSFTNERYESRLHPEEGEPMYNPDLAAATIKFAELAQKGTDEDLEKGEAILAHSLIKNNLMYVHRRDSFDKEPLVQTLKETEEEEPVPYIYVFTDINELRKCYPDPTYAGSHMSIGDLSTRYPQYPLLLNGGTTSMIIGSNIYALCEHYRDIYNQIVSFAILSCGYEQEAAELAAKDIIYYETICTEFLAGIRPDHFEYPQYNQVTVEGYSADAVRKTTSKNPIDVYRALAEMGKHPDKVQQILYQK